MTWEYTILVPKRAAGDVHVSASAKGNIAVSRVHVLAVLIYSLEFGSWMLCCVMASSMPESLPTYLS
jgi:hypothetical protein